MTYAATSAISSGYGILQPLTSPLRQLIIEGLKGKIPVFHSRAMRKLAFEKYGIMPAVSKSVLCFFYKDVTNDSSAAANLTEAEIDERVKMLFDLEEPDVMMI